MNRLLQGETPNGDEILELNRAGAAPDMIAAVSRTKPEDRNKIERPALGLIVDLGRPVVPAGSSAPEHLAPIVTNPAVVAYLAKTLKEANADLRDEAGAVLADQVPEPALRANANAILEALRQYPGTTGGALILGRIGSAEAKKLVDSVEGLRLTSPEDTEIAVARLGDKQAEERVIKGYQTAADARSKGRESVRVGYIATPNAVKTLARDMRTSESYVWRMNSRRSLRIYLIAGLHRAFLNEPVFWKPYYKPEDDSYYERIEAWLESHLGVKWTEPRPPFLYEEDAPLPPGRH